MVEEKVKFETAVIAKEKGFDWDSLRFKGIISGECIEHRNWNKYNNGLSKPTQSLLQR